MSLVYAGVSIDGQKVAEYSLVGAQFAQQIAKLLSTKSASTGVTRVSYTSDQKMFNLQSRDNINFVAVCDNNPKHQALAYRFLDKVMNAFLARFGDSVSALTEAKTFSSALKKEMEYHNSPEADKVGKLKEEIDNVKGIMTENIEKILERGEKVEKLVEKTEDLAHQSDDFFKSSRSLRKQMMWKNIKLALGIFVLLALVIFIIVLFACGGFTFKDCKGNDATAAPGMVTLAPPTPAP